MITVRKRFADYFLHDFGTAFFVKLLKRFVIHLSINEFNIHRHKTIPYKQIIIYYPSDAAIAINKWVGVFKDKIQPRNTLYNIFMAGCVVSGKHFFQSSY